MYDENGNWTGWGDSSATSSDPLYDYGGFPSYTSPSTTDYDWTSSGPSDTNWWESYGSTAPETNWWDGVTSVAGSALTGASSLLNPLLSGLSGIAGSPLGAALAGGLLGSQSGATPSGTTTSTQAPWTGQQPFLQDVWNKASAQSWGNDPLAQKASLNYANMLGGPSENPMAGMNNPYLNTAINNAQGDFMRGFQPLQNQANVQSGSFGNTGVADIYSRNASDQMGKIGTNMRMQDYTAQQNMAENAVNRTANATSGVHEFNFAPLKNYGSLVTGTNFGSTQTSPYFSNPLAGAAGGALAGAELYKSLMK